VREGSIILTAIVKADGQRKNRPALLLREMPKYGDLLICGISTQLRQYLTNFDEIIKTEDSGFVTSGLVRESLIRLAFLAVHSHSLLGTQIVGINSISHNESYPKFRSRYHFLRSWCLTCRNNTFLVGIFRASLHQNVLIRTF
jgi:mRNA interferase MazF